VIEFEEILTKVPTIYIYDISGKKITTINLFDQQGKKTLELDIGFLVPGVYLFEIISSDKTYSLKILKY